ncbi:MAG: PilW family protein [Cocleimonas sp.]|nr:PilW family protein [Cocleimonas sp.]
MKTQQQQQAGLSLVEMMIAMVLGILLSVGTATIYFSSQRTSLAQSQYLVLEDNGRLALEVLTQVIEHTGYVSSNTSPLAGDDRFITSNVVAASCGGQNNVLKTSLFGKTENKSAGDSIGVVYLGDSSINRDCSGAQLPAPCQVGGVGSVEASKIYNYFSVGVNADKIPVLHCAGSRGTNRIEIAEGVENLQVLYGIDNDADNQVDQYVNADKVSSWGRVVVVQLALLVRSLNKVKNKKESKTFTLLDNTDITVDDKYQRAVFSTTIRLRNVQL